MKASTIRWTKAAGNLLALFVASWPSAVHASEAARAHSQFALALYSTVRDYPGNLTVSPISLSSALLIADAGARGRTATQLEHALALPKSGPAMRAQASALLRDLRQASAPECQVLIANSVWLQQDYSVEREFLEVATGRYSAAIAFSNFREPDTAREKINTWCRTNTAGKIPSLVPGGVLNPETRMVIANALYFKGRWARPFEKRLTLPGVFYANGNQEVKAMKMHASMHLKCTQDKTLTMADFPYGSGLFSMLVLLPRDRGGLPELERTLTPQRLAKLERRLTSQHLIVSLPRFSAGGSFDLRQALESLGARDAFVPGVANFTGINSRDDLYISALVHQASLVIDEEGAEGAAGSLAGVSLAFDDPLVKFDVDHPFLFIVRHNPTGAMLFIGRVVDPTVGAALDKSQGGHHE